MVSLCLTHEEIVEVTLKHRYSAQLRVLRALGLEAKPRPDGTVLVDRAVYEEWVRGGARKQRKTQEKTEPIWN